MRLILSAIGALAILTVVVVLRRRRWLRQEQADVDQRIRANRARPAADFAIADDGLRVRTLERRKDAERLRRRAAHVDSGAHSRGDLRAVK